MNTRFGVAAIGPRRSEANGARRRLRSSIYQGNP